MSANGRPPSVPLPAGARPDRHDLAGPTPIEDGGPATDPGPGVRVTTAAIGPLTDPGRVAPPLDPARAVHLTDPGRPGPATEPGRAATGGRHARRDAGSGPPTVPRPNYVPRHSRTVTENGADNGAGNGAEPVSPHELTEVFSRVRRDPTERPRPARPDSTPPARDTATATALAPEDPAVPGKRVRVVLSQRKGTARPVRTVVDVRELTQVGEVLSTSLIRSQLGLALRIGGIALVVLGALPAMFAMFPVLGRVELFGLRLPWLLLGVLAYPFLLALGWMYARSAEKLEQVFADHIDD